MGCLRLLFWDQLSETIPTLHEADRKQDILLMPELMQEAKQVKHHKKKLVLLFSAMRHFAEQRRQEGWQVIYTTISAANSEKTWIEHCQDALTDHGLTRVVITKPSNFRRWQELEAWQKKAPVPVTILADNRFYCTEERFRAWAQGRKQLRMEYFYREMRSQYNILMDEGKPCGGQWNYDAENRKPPKEGLVVPAPFSQPTDSITQSVMQEVTELFPDHFGSVEGFHVGVTRAQAVASLKQFVSQRLVSFGDYQDAMLEGEPWMYHAHISFYLNCGLLVAQECVELAEQAWRNGQAPLAAVEGFIRQILGWREYVRGIYWLKMPDYAEVNALEAQRPLPEFYWTGQTKMRCLQQCVQETKEHAYAHHIQRLMVLGNFALIAGIDPQAVNEWFWVVYMDAYQWVELPNVSGMILFADGGYLASKPYAAGGSYINKMSNYCKNCAFKVTEKHGANACPFNYLYWDFMARNREKLAGNNRISMMLKTYERMPQEKKDQIAQDAATFLADIP